MHRRSAPLVTVRRLLGSAGLSFALGGLAACTGPAGDACGLSGVPPAGEEISEDAVEVKIDDELMQLTGSWKRPPGGSLTAGNLDVIIEHDEEGRETADLIDEGSFPICVPIGARAEDSGQANYVEGGFVSDETHGGMLSILDSSEDRITGRFSFELQNPAGDVMTFEDGVFWVPER